jgi:hypothetical protein
MATSQTVCHILTAVSSLRNAEPTACSLLAGCGLNEDARLIANGSIAGQS